MYNLKFYLIPEKETLSVESDFNEIKAFLSPSVEEEIPDKVNMNLINDENGQMLYSALSLVPTPNAASQIEFNTTRGNTYSIERIRTVAQQVGYRVFSVELGCFLPNSQYIVDLYTHSLANEMNDVVLKKGYEPLFCYNYKSGSLYAKSRDDGKIYFLNPYLIDYFLAFQVDLGPNPEFSYEVAPTIQQFVAKFDAGLIPVHFYQGYQKEFKILNYSNFDIVKPGRKVFFKPIVFELNDRKGKFYMKVGEKGAMVVMDKIREGETLHDSLTRFLKENTIADDYIGAVVTEDIEFDRDKEGILIPRLTIFLYVDKINALPPETQRTWS